MYTYSILFYFKLDNQKTEFNIYNFDQEPPQNRYFDISECFDQHNESRSYALIIRADVEKYNLDRNIGQLQYWMSFSLEVNAGIRALRIHDIQVISLYVSLY